MRPRRRGPAPPRSVEERGDIKGVPGDGAGEERENQERWGKKGGAPRRAWGELDEKYIELVEGAIIKPQKGRARYLPYKIVSEIYGAIRMCEYCGQMLEKGTWVWIEEEEMTG